MKEFQQRVIKEQRKLSSKLDKLKQFMESETYRTLDTQDRALLGRQFNAMAEYDVILQQRIRLFEEGSR